MFSKVSLSLALAVSAACFGQISTTGGYATTSSAPMTPIAPIISTPDIALPGSGPAVGAPLSNTNDPRTSTGPSIYDPNYAIEGFDNNGYYSAAISVDILYDDAIPVADRPCWLTAHFTDTGETVTNSDGHEFDVWQSDTTYGNYVAGNYTVTLGHNTNNGQADGGELTATKRMSHRWMVRANASLNDYTESCGKDSFANPTPALPAITAASAFSEPSTARALLSPQ